ncbi:hypothetical protein [Aquimarina sp. MAR_2010_214]|uniref:hypothetical protein n=1 Tax=Aquimarina sp. MAR_2010_214 TaxID=1250026 RepID=UPI00117829F6|nr:hypothetical protein [Aquimarina sp. MAR_2010_214]
MDDNNGKTNYMNVLFANYILNELDFLSEEKKQTLNKLNLYIAYNREKEDWTKTVAAVLNFSPTIDIAIWHLWIKNLRIADKKGIEYSPEQFAQGFIDNYYVKNSKVDVWGENQLKEAKLMIKEYKEQLTTKNKHH